MPQQPTVTRMLKFQGAANHSTNIEGNINPSRLVFYDHFTGIAVDTTNNWNSAGQASGAVAQAAPHMATITTEGNDDDEWALSTGLHFYGQYNAACEVRLRNDDLDGLTFYVGFSDAVSESGTIAFTYSGTTLTSNASDGAGFVWDTNADTDYVYAVSSKNNADGTVISTGLAITKSTWATFRVELRDNGSRTDAIFYFNKTGNAINPVQDYVGTEIDALTRTDPLCVTIACMNEEAAANTLDIDYVKAWQDEY